MEARTFAPGEVEMYRRSGWFQSISKLEFTVITSLVCRDAYRAIDQSADHDAPGLKQPPYQSMRSAGSGRPNK